MKKKKQAGGHASGLFYCLLAPIFRAKMPTFDEEKICLCALNRIFGYEPRIVSALIRHLGSAKEVFSLGKDTLDEILGPHSKYAGQIGPASLESAEKELIEASALGIAFIGRGEKGYPELLSECEDAPSGLYIRSRTPETCLAGDRDFISIVGTRNISAYGRDWCRQIVQALAHTEKPPVIVSGLAYGTDITAHLAALDAGLRTIAVMATGADSVYPAAHRGHAGRIAASDGSAAITDYPLRTRAVAINFIRRNRIIAGISRATVLIESRARGGGMITARQAFSYDRDVFALPGRADDPMSEGCNILVRSGCAIPVTSMEDFISSLGYTPEKKAERNIAEICRDRPAWTGRTDEIARVLLHIKKNRRISIQELADATGLGFRVTAEITGLLESDGFISVDLMQRCSINGKNA